MNESPFENAEYPETAPVFKAIGDMDEKEMLAEVLLYMRSIAGLIEQFGPAMVALQQNPMLKALLRS